MNDNFDDIILLPHYEPKQHPRMSMMSRAAQFAPFAALTGHNDAIQETGRYTESPMALNGRDNSLLNARLSVLSQRIIEEPEVTLTCFVPDKKKTGGSFQTMGGRLRRIHEHTHELMLTDGTLVSLESLLSIDSPLFD